jgi:tRNA U38,U39,U40 pseudouridine synthase TruA
MPPGALGPSEEDIDQLFHQTEVAENAKRKKLKSKPEREGKDDLTNRAKAYKKRREKDKHTKDELDASKTKHPKQTKERLKSELSKPASMVVNNSVPRHNKSSVTSMNSNWRCEMDNAFPKYSEEGKARIEYFRKLKKILKKIAGKRSFHNFASGGACPDDLVANRRLDRIFHKEIRNFAGVDYVIFRSESIE